MTKHKTKGMKELDIDMVQPNPLQPRGTILPKTLQELVNSIKEHGILEPLVVAHTPAGYQIIAGERRWRAAKLAGLKKVPVIIKETTPKGMLEMAIVENVQRTDLNPIERAKAFDRLIKEFGLGVKDIAQRIGKSPAYVSNSLRLLELPDALTDGLIGGLITEGHARALAGIRDTRLMIEAYKIVLKENASVRRAEEIARQFRKKEGTLASTEHHRGHPAYIVSKEIDEIQRKLARALGGKTQVKLIRTRRETRLLIKLKGNPEQTEERLQKILAIANS